EGAFARRHDRVQVRRLAAERLGGVRRGGATREILGLDRQRDSTNSWEAVLHGDTDPLRPILQGQVPCLGCARIGARAASFQNCPSPITVTLCPFDARRRTLISFEPPSFPAICSAFGRPRTRTSVPCPGFDCTIAPARLAAAIASRRGRERKPVNDSRAPLRLFIRPSRGSLGRCRNAAISSLAASSRAPREPRQRWMTSFRWSLHGSRRTSLLCMTL